MPAFLQRKRPPAEPIEPAPPATPVTIERYDFCLADLSPEALRSTIADLNSRADTVGCAVFRPPGEHPCVAVIFAGNIERFFMLAAARHLHCPVMLCQDPISYWYQGSPLLPELDMLCRTVVAPEVGSSRALLFGQSSGGYAALAAAALLPGATAVACAPQTFSDAAAKDRINFVGVRALRTPDGLIDVAERLAARPDPDGMRAALIAAGELDNPAHMHWWGDYFHLLRLARVPDMELHVVNANTHVLAHGRVNEYAVLLRALADEIGAPRARRAEILAAFLAEQYRPA